MGIPIIAEDITLWFQYTFQSWGVDDITVVMQDLVFAYSQPNSKAPRGMIYSYNKMRWQLKLHIHVLLTCQANSDLVNLLHQASSFRNRAEIYASSIARMLFFAGAWRRREQRSSLLVLWFIALIRIAIAVVERMLPTSSVSKAMQFQSVRCLLQAQVKWFLHRIVSFMYCCFVIFE